MIAVCVRRPMPLATSSIPLPSPAPFHSLTVTALGEIETEDTDGVVRGQLERFPPTIFLRETELTTQPRRASPVRRGCHRSATMIRLSLLHTLNGAIHNRMHFDTGRTDRYSRRPGRRSPPGTASARTTPISSSPPPAISAFPHAMSAAISTTPTWASRKRGMAGPKRWSPISAGLPSIRPTAFPLPTPMSRVAVGLDYLGAAPIRGARHGGTDETLTVKLRVDNVGL